MFCKYCGNQIESTDIICPHCSYKREGLVIKAEEVTKEAAEMKSQATQSTGSNEIRNCEDINIKSNEIRNREDTNIKSKNEQRLHKRRKRQKRNKTSVILLILLIIFFAFGIMGMGMNVLTTKRIKRVQNRLDTMEKNIEGIDGRLTDVQTKTETSSEEDETQEHSEYEGTQYNQYF